MDALIEYIERTTGLDFKERKPLTQQKIDKFINKYNIGSYQSLLFTIKAEKGFFDEFIDILTINETYFFREKEAIIVALTGMIQTQVAPYHILVAPSSSGEEVYTVLILLKEMGVNLKDVYIDGVDISKKAIKKAQHACYNERSLHRLPSEVKNKYFIFKNDTYQLNNILQVQVTFYQKNIFEVSTLAKKYDLIFSRNLFIYFSDNYKLKAYKELQNICKNKYTQIVLGHADISSYLAKYIKKQERR